MAGVASDGTADEVQLALLAQEVGARGAVDVLHDDEVAPRARIAPRVVDLDDVGVLEAGGRLRLAAEARDEGLVLGQVLGQQLDGHPPLEHLVHREVDRRHPAGAEPALDAVAARDLGGGAHPGRPPPGSRRRARATRRPAPPPDRYAARRRALLRRRRPGAPGRRRSSGPAPGAASSGGSGSWSGLVLRGRGRGRGLGLVVVGGGRLPVVVVVSSPGGHCSVHELARGGRRRPVIVSARRRRRRFVARCGRALRATVSAAPQRSARSAAAPRRGRRGAGGSSGRPLRGDGLALAAAPGRRAGGDREGEKSDACITDRSRGGPPARREAGLLDRPRGVVDRVIGPAPLRVPASRSSRSQAARGSPSRGWPAPPGFMIQRPSEMSARCARACPPAMRSSALAQK